MFLEAIKPTPHESFSEKSNIIQNIVIHLSPN
jgi:hypothetical protein